jgi:diacylglycerol kinase family enzyme
MIHALVLGRRRTGRKIGQAVRDTQGMLEAAGWKVDSVVVRRKRDLRRQAADGVKAGVDVVVAVGGDGAVLQVVNALAETKVALGIIPRGTGNLLAGNLRIPHRLDRAVDVLVNGRHRRIDLGRVTVGGEDHDFAVACGIGFDARVMQATEDADKRRWGKLAYFATARDGTSATSPTRSPSTASSRPPRRPRSSSPISAAWGGCSSRAGRSGPTMAFST